VGSVDVVHVPMDDDVRHVIVVDHICSYCLISHHLDA